MQRLKVFASRRAREQEWIVGRWEEGTPLKVKPRSQRNQEDVEPSSRWLKRIRRGVCTIFRRSEKRNVGWTNL
jgi:hypothetical protein